MQTCKSFGILTCSGWVLVLPATLLLGAAALRQLQPQQFEPAHTASLIFAWTTAHVSQFGAGLVFLGLPGLVAVTGCAALLANWRQNQEVRNDTTALLGILRRQTLPALLLSATLLAGAILGLVLAHVLTD